MGIKYSKIRNVKSLQRGTSLSAGIDFFVPVFDEQFKKDFKELNNHASFTDWLTETHIYIAPGKTVKIPSGIKINLPDSFFMLLCNKSSVSADLGLAKLAEVIDSDYQGELLFILNNQNSKPVYVAEGMKIIQGVLVANITTMFEEVEQKVLFDKESERGTNGFGSTGGF
jgi:dUTP pyrophosphatase